MYKKIKSLILCFMVMVLAWGFVNMNSVQVEAQTLGENLISNPNFSSTNVNSWGVSKGNASLNCVTGDEVIFGDVKTYGAITNRTAHYQCFAQDVTAVVENGKEYQFSFYAMLSDDYNNAPAEQRVVAFSPYVTINGQTSYLGDYSGEISGTGSQTLTPGEWTYFEGTFTIDYNGSLDQVVIRLTEQGSNYGQGECVLGDYYVTGVTLKEMKEEPLAIEDVEPLWEAITDDTEEGFIVGTAISESELTEEGVVLLVNKHFNAITPGNALKPDAIFNYSNYYCPGTKTITFNGEQMVVPVTDFSRAEQILDKILEWNAQNPQKAIKVRGHVLVWHAQTPEWFFHKNYNASQDYVSKEEMDKRLEWYIMTVLQHFTGDDSPYKDLFYGWDVVNEAVSDSTGTYRTDTENASESLSQATHGSNSSWWHVYESEEYIINAFRYANKYAPASLELYYNDYSTCYSPKMSGISTLLKAIKEEEGTIAENGTRIDGMGMQAHYSMNTPGAAAFESAIREFAAIVGSVQITEMDIKASSSYDGSDDSKLTEYINQGYRYKEFYDVILKLRSEGLSIDGLTVWGVVDKNSWLQSSANVGGGTTGTQVQCPLLFDDDYMVKPAYWAFVDSSKIATYTLPSTRPTITPDDSQEALVSAFVERMYTVALGREAEAEGLADWTQLLLDHEVDGAGIAQGFILSDEFEGKNYSDEAYIKILYGTFFDREPAEEECAGWLQLIEEGRSREYVLAGFVNSDEFDALCERYGIVRGSMSEDGVAVKPGIRRFVEHLYTAALGREGEEAGVESWTNQLIQGTCSPEYLAKYFFFSEEYLAKNTRNAEYVEALYLTFLDREADEEGKEGWVRALNNGMSREEVLERFAQSDEFTALKENYFGESGQNTVSGERRFVEHLYIIILQRIGDQAGIEGWTEQIETGACTPEFVAKNFFLSNEYISKNVSDEKYIDDLYHAYLDRDADEEGKVGWINALNSGMSREEILDSFSQSEEFQKIKARYGLE